MFLFFLGLVNLNGNKTDLFGFLLVFKALAV